MCGIYSVEAGIFPVEKSLAKSISLTYLEEGTGRASQPDLRVLPPQLTFHGFRVSLSENAQSNELTVRTGPQLDDQKISTHRIPFL